MIDVAEKAKAGEWQQTARILCECNCGIAVRLGDEGTAGRGAISVGHSVLRPWPPSVLGTGRTHSRRRRPARPL